MSNNKDVLGAVEKVDRKFGKNDEYLLQDLPEETALGMKWGAQQDILKFKLNMEQKPLTRRGMLSTISSIYDPLGLVGPFILEGRQVLQKLCKRNNSWDEEIPEDINKEWLSWRNRLTEIEAVQIQRCYKPAKYSEVENITLHYFADASEAGYGIACYLRFVNLEKKSSLYPDIW